MNKRASQKICVSTCFWAFFTTEFDTTFGAAPTFCPRVAREIRKNARIIQKTSDFSEQLAINRPKMTENVLKMRVGLAARVLVQNETLKCEEKWRAKSLKTTGAQGFFLHSLIDS